MSDRERRDVLLQGFGERIQYLGRVLTDPDMRRPHMAALVCQYIPALEDNGVVSKTLATHIAQSINFLNRNERKSVLSSNDSSIIASMILASLPRDSLTPFTSSKTDLT